MAKAQHRRSTICTIPSSGSDCDRKVHRKAESFFISAIPLGHRLIGWLPVSCHASRTRDCYDRAKRAKLFAFPPESRSPSHRNAVRNHNGMPSSFSPESRSPSTGFPKHIEALEYSKGAAAKPTLVEFWHVGDDGLSQRLAGRVEREFDRSP